jgi:hypothetical protein
VATGTGSAAGGSASIEVSAEGGSSTGQAYNPSIAATGFTNASADVATGIGTAFNGSPALLVYSAAASGTGAALDATASQTVYAPAALASGTGSAADAAIAIKVFAETATGSGQASDATVTISAAGTATAGLAAGSGTAFDATVSAVSAVVPPAGQSSAGRRRRGVRLDRFGVPIEGPEFIKPLPVFVDVAAGIARGRGEAFDATTVWDDDETAILLLLAA